VNVIELYPEHVAVVFMRTFHLSGAGSYEQSPRLLEAYGTDGVDSDGSAGPGETQLREDLADAMMESPGIPTHDTGNYFMSLLLVLRSMKLLFESYNVHSDSHYYDQHVFT
jgi:hypothetical protein